MASHVRGLWTGLLLLAGSAATLASCRGRDSAGGGEPIGTRTSALAADASGIVSALKARAGSPLAAGAASRFDAVTGGLKPQFSASDVVAEPAPARVTLPQQASAPLHLEDAATSVAVDVSLSGAGPVAAQAADGYIVYPNALASGATFLHRAMPGGTEDFVAFEAKPATLEVAFDLALGRGASGLRLVAGALEVLDAGGAPRLHVAPPFIVGADGARTDAALAVAGCAVDTNPAPPWGRPVTAPGATTCQVKVTWPGSGVVYPAILDPRWTTTGSMITARQDHTMTLLSTGKVLVTGGRSTTGTTGLATAELYDKTTGTWAATASMSAGRFLHRATQLNTGSNATTSGKVLISGGINGTTSLSTFQLYDPTAGTWGAAGNLNTARHGHAATLLADGKVLIAGGLGGTTTLATAAIYNPASGSGSWAATTGPLPPTGQKNHTAVLLQTSNQQLNNKVLLVGGNSGTTTLNVVYLFDPAQSAFSTLQAMPAAREGHTMTVLANGKVLVTGGKNGSTTLNTTAIFDPGFGPGSWSTAGTMTSARSGHTATLLPASIVANGQVLVAGGNSGSATLSSAELFSGTSTWTATPAMPAPAQAHTAVLLGSNMILIAGGLNGSTVLSAARLYDASFGLGCSSASQCPSGFCANGVCCDTACTGACGACNLAGSLGTCTALASGTVCRAAAAGGCDVAETCNGSALTCPSDAFAPSSTVCRTAADVCDLAENCPGNAAACPADAKKGSGTACADDGLPCTTDTCNGASVACQHAAGNAGTVCRAVADVCDLAETCTGSATACPADAKKGSGTACADDGLPCTTDTCNGSSVVCQHPAGNAGTQCRAAADLCDLAATCTGSSATCPANPFKPSSTVCRGAAGECDLGENCTGAAAACPSDAKKPNGTACTDDGVVCTADTCNGSAVACQHPAGHAGTVCRAAAGQCDVAETCTGGSISCPGDASAPNGTSCSDGNSCTSPDTCQSGGCAAGANTCAAIAVTETVSETHTQPVLTATLQTDPLIAAPGDVVAFTSTVTNAKTILNISAEFNVHNTSASAFVIGAYRQTLEYQAVPGGVWTPFARRAYDAAGNLIPEAPPLLQLEYGIIFPSGGNANYLPGGVVVGVSIPAGGDGHWAWTAGLNVPPDILAIIFDPAQSSGIRAVASFDVPSAPPQIGTAALAYPGLNPDVDNITAQLTFALLPNAGSADAGGALTSTGTGPLAPGASRVYTGTFIAPPMTPFPAFVGETEAQYRNRLFFASTGYPTRVAVDAHATPANPAQAQAITPVSIELPLLVNAQKTGPASINAGLTGHYSLTLPNTGTGVAGPFTIADSVDGSPVTIGGLSVPATVAASATGAATFTAAVPLARPAGPMTDVAMLTWKDRNANVYGPITASFTGTINAGHPEGYLSIAGTTDIPALVGSTVPLTVTALDPFGNPAPGVSVHFAATGAHPQTTNVTTGADGKATFSYTAATIGNDDVVASATITTTVVTTNSLQVQWATSIGTACTGRATPLDIVLVVDMSPSMVLEPLGGTSAGKLEAAQASAHRFIDDLTYSRDQLGIVTFRGSAILDAQLGTNAANAKTQLDARVTEGIFCATNFCGGGGSNLAAAIDTALDELEGPRHNAGATKVLVYVGDGGADTPPTAQLTRLHNSGARAVAIAIGSAIDGALIRQIASSPNDYFYAPSAAGVDFAFNNLNQDVCRNLPPVVSAGGDQGAYGVRIPSMLALQGEVHDDGPDGDQRLTSLWTTISGPTTVAFEDPTSPVTNALFTEPGTYILQLEATDGYLTVADRATVTVDPDPSIVGANLAVALSAAGPLETGQTETLTATLTDGLGAPIRNFAVRLTVAGANPFVTTAITDNAGVVAFPYQGAKVGTDVLHATALGSSFALDSSSVSVVWIQPASGGAALTQGWIAAPLDHSKLAERVPVVLSPAVTLASGTVKYFPAAEPSEVHILAANVSGAPGATLATFDTTVVPNDSYVLELDGTDSSGNQKTSVVLVTVTGDYKPGRVVFEITDFTLPIAGLPITVGRRYDSLEKDKVGEFGHGWSLTVGHPRVEVDPNHAVSITLPNGRRATFDLRLDLPPFAVLAGPANPFRDVYFTGYQAEPGVFGTLTQTGGCPVVRYFPEDPANPVHCFFTFGLPPDYVPDGYVYTDPYGTAYSMAASGEMRSIKDRQGNTLSFEPNGIISDSGKSVAFERDTQGRITKVTTPPFFVQGSALLAAEYQYAYDANGDLTTVTLPPSPDPAVAHYTYNQHRLTTTVDPRGNPARTSTYYADGRLHTDTDALNNVTTYAYDLATRTNTTTYPDTGVLTETFDARGLLVSETDPLGHTTAHQYDANRNETKRTNALGEETIATYDDRGNQTSVTDPLGTTHTTYNELNLPVTFVDRLNHTTTIDYDDRGVPARFADELGTRFAFTSSEQGVPLTVDDAAGKRAFITYDVAGNVTSRTDWLGRVTQATYDQAGHRLTETTARGGVTTNQYARNGKLGFTRDANGYETNLGYDPNGNLVSQTDNAGRQKNSTYNALNHLTQVTDFPDGATAATVSFTRDFRGNPLTTTDENAHTTTYEYDHAGNLTKTTFADTKLTTRTYDELNRLASATDERSHTTTYQYEEGCGCSDRVTVVTDPLGHATTTAYDANGRRSSVTDANGHTTSFVYDVRNHLLETHYQDGTVVIDAYDPRGRRVMTKDQTNAVTTFGYDDQGQLTSVTDPLNNVTAYAYDPDGNLTSVTDANNHTTTYEHDLLKRKTKRTLPLGQFETFAYNLPSDQTFHTDFRGKTTQMTYDRRDRMLTKVPDPSLGEATHSYTYSPTNMRLSSIDGSGATTYSYDLRDRMLTKAATAGILTYTYDATGNVATIRSSNTNGTSVDYAWDAANQFVSVADNRVGGTTTAAYTPTKRPASLDQPNGVGLAYSYDSLDRVTSMLWRQGASPAFGRWAYTHNERGQRLTSTDITGRSATYGYDAGSRLASEAITSDPRGASFNGALSYILDGAGNRLSRTSTLAALGAQSFTYNANDEISGDTYDTNGNTLTSGSHTFAYDFENRLVSKDNGVVTITYDCDGNRVAKAVGGVTTRYLIDDLNPTGYLQVLEEVASGAVQTRYTYGTNVVSRTRDVPTTPVTNFYGYDAHGSITFLTDSVGSVIASYDYDAWGNLVASTGSTPNSRLYAGEEFDPDLGVVNLRTRLYQPGTGRFLKLDLALGRPLDPLSLNRYLYSEADPVNRIDPWGLDSEYAILARESTGVLLSPTTIALGAGGAKLTTTVIGAAVAAYASACAMYVVATALETTAPGVQPASPPPPFTLCRACKPCQGPLPPPEDRLDTTHSHGPCPGAHIHHYRWEWQQDPKTCRCFTKKVDEGFTCL